MKAAPQEPLHIHVRGGGSEAKIWLEPDVSIAESYGFNSRELARILRVVTENRNRIARAWHEYFPDSGPF